MTRNGKWNLWASKSLPSGGNIMPIIFWVEGQVSIEKTIRKWSQIFIENFLFSTRNMHFNLILLSRVSNDVSIFYRLNCFQFDVLFRKKIANEKDVLKCKCKSLSTKWYTYFLFATFVYVQNRWIFLFFDSDSFFFWYFRSIGKSHHPDDVDSETFDIVEKR